MIVVVPQPISNLDKTQMAAVINAIDHCLHQSAKYIDNVNTACTRKPLQSINSTGSVKKHFPLLFLYSHAFGFMLINC